MAMRFFNSFRRSWSSGGINLGSILVSLAIKPDLDIYGSGAGSEEDFEVNLQGADRVSGSG
jgi:hypothetical protein